MDTCTENQEEQSFMPSIFEKLIEPMNAYALCKLKILQLRSRGRLTSDQIKAIQEIQDLATFHATEIQNTVPNFFDNQ